jgi:hypothetical protein
MILKSEKMLKKNKHKKKLKIKDYNYFSIYSMSLLFLCFVGVQLLKQENEYYSKS